MTYKIVSNKVLPKQLSNQKNTHTYTTMMQLEVVAVWVFLLVSIAGLTEGKQGPFIVYCERGMEGMDGMGWQVPMGHKGKGGEAGATGSQGPPGPQGQKGDSGGLQGSTRPQGQRGVAGARALRAPPGPRSGGVVYTRWGKTSCPNVSGTQLV